MRASTLSQLAGLTGLTGLTGRTPAATRPGTLEVLPTMPNVWRAR